VLVDKLHHREHSQRVCETAKSADTLGNGLYRASLDIISIETHHETSAELSKPPGHDGITSRYLLAVPTRSTPEGAKSVDFVTKSASHTSSALQLAGLDIISIEPRQNTSAEPSRSPGDDDDASWSVLPVRESIPRVGVAKLSESARTWGVGLCRAGFHIRSIVTHHETCAEPSRSSEDDADAVAIAPNLCSNVPHLLGVNNIVHSSGVGSGNVEKGVPTHSWDP
jgi:hypothetical protein